MRHFYEVLSYDEKNMAHKCKDHSNQEEHLIDLFINGDLKDRKEKEIVGKIISVDYTYPWLSIAMGVRIE